MPALHHLRPRLVSIVTMLLLWYFALALAQSAPEIPPGPTQSVAAAVVSIGVVALEPNAESSTLDSLAKHPASIHGSGFFVDKKGHVVTALHVVRAAEHARDQMQRTDNRLIVGLRSAVSSLFPRNRPRTSLVCASSIWRT